MNINIKKDTEADVWVAICDELGLVLESGSYDALIEKVKITIPELKELNGIEDNVDFLVCTEDQQMICA